METKLYNKEGKEAGKLTVPAELFGLPWNADLVHQVVESMRSNARAGTAHTKDRGEVRGGGKKPWQQKGTGRARHGSSRSPIWKGGGVAHGPRNEKSYEKRLTTSMKRKALLVALSRKYKDGEIVFVDRLEMAAPKAADAKKVLAALNIPMKRNAALIALSARNVPTLKSFRNFNNVGIEEVRNLNPLSVLGKKTLIIENPSAAFEVLGKVHGIGEAAIPRTKAAK